MNYTYNTCCKDDDDVSKEQIILNVYFHHVDEYIKVTDQYMLKSQESISFFENYVTIFTRYVIPFGFYFLKKIFRDIKNYIITLLLNDLQQYFIYKNKMFLDVAHICNRISRYLNNHYLPNYASLCLDKPQKRTKYAKHKFIARTYFTYANTSIPYESTLNDLMVSYWNKRTKVKREMFLF